LHPKLGWERMVVKGAKKRGPVGVEVSFLKD